MKKIKSVLTILTIMIVFIIPIFGIIVSTNDEIIEIDNRKISQFPEFDKKFCKNLSSYIGDRLLFKEYIADNYYNVYSSYFVEDGLSASVVNGVDGWLFLGNRYQDIVNKHTKKVDINYRNLQGYIKKLNKIQSIFGAERFLLVIVPDKVSIYDEYFPVPISKKNRFVDKLMPELEDNFALIDLYKALMKSKCEGRLLYYTDDSHWNILGAYVGFREILNVLNVGQIDLNFQPGQRNLGDLARINGQQPRSTNWIRDDTWYPIVEKQAMNIRFSEPSIAPRSDPFVGEPIDVVSGNYGYAISFHNQQAKLDKTIFLLTDSMGTALAPFATLAFKNVIWVNRYIDLEKMLAEVEKVTELRPDYMIYVSAERLVGDQY